MEGQHFYHVATKGLTDNILFENEEQFIAAMNRIAVCALMFPKLSIIAFCLMDNHMHLIIWGTKSEIGAFMYAFKHSTEIWLAHHAPESKGKTWEYDSWPLWHLDDLIRTICYIFRNPMVAGMAVQPACYRWSTCSLMYSNNPVPWGSKRASEFSVNQLRRILNTRLEIPEDWLIQPDGMIWPGSYVNYKDAMNKIGSVSKFVYEMSKKNEDDINAEMYGNSVSLPDGEVKKIVLTVAEAMFEVKDLALLTPAQRVKLCVEMKKTYGCNLKQLARVLRVHGEELRNIFQAIEVKRDISQNRG